MAADNIRVEHVGSISGDDPIATLLLGAIRSKIEHRQAEQRTRMRAADAGLTTQFLNHTPRSRFSPGTKVKWREPFGEPSNIFPPDFVGYVTHVYDRPEVVLTEQGHADIHDVLVAAVLPCDAPQCLENGHTDGHLVEFPMDSRRLAIVTE